jgi:Flp pilus assembly protein TadD
LRRVLLLAVVASLPAAVSARAQSPSDHAAVLELRDAGRFADAAERLRPWVVAHPDDGGSRWLLGQLLWWSGQRADARPELAAALALLPDDPWLRLEHGELLLALDARRDARFTLGAMPAGAPAEARARAETLLGILAWRSEDLPEAVRRFEAALAHSPGRPDALAGLSDIRASLRSWTTIELGVRDDDQPLRRVHASLLAGTFLSPLWSAAVGVTPHHIDVDPARRGGEAWLEVRGTVPRAGARLVLRGGGVRAGGVDGPDGSGATTWTGSAEVSVRTALGARARVSASRERYLWTRSGADTLLVPWRVEAALDRASSPGWAGEAAGRLEGFPDGNRVTSAWAWVLAPLASGVRVGYALSWQDARESRWTAREAATTPGPVPGRYAPYYTPERATTHSLLAELRAAAGALDGSLSGSWAFHAREQAPVLLAVDGVAPELAFFSRTIEPWRISAAAGAALDERTRLELRAEQRRTAYYRLTELVLTLRVRFGGSP